MDLQNKCLDEFFMIGKNSMYQADIYDSLTEFYHHGRGRPGKYYQTLEKALTDIEDVIPEEWIQKMVKKEELYQMSGEFYKTCDMPQYKYK